MTHLPGANAGFQSPNPPFRRPLILWAIGDSIIANNNVRDSATQYHNSARGEICWAQALLWGEFSWEMWLNTSDPLTATWSGPNRGKSGDATSSVHARLTRDMLNFSPPAAIYATAVNDLWGSVLASTAIANTKQDVLQMANAGIYTLVATCRPWAQAYDGFVVGGTDVGQQKIIAYNTGIRSWIAALNHPRIKLWDVAADVYGMVEGLNTSGGTYLASDGTTSLKSATQTAWLYADPAYYADGQLHPGNGYGYLGGKSLANRLKALGWVRNVTNSSNLFKDVWLQDGSNLLSTAQSTFTGSTTATGTGISGSRPTNVTLSSSGVTGGSTAVASLVSNAESGGQSIVLTVTPGGTSANDTWTFTVSVTGTPPAWPKGGWEIEFDNSAYWVGAYLGLSQTGGTNNVIGLYIDDVKQWYPEARRYLLTCPALELNGTPTALNMTCVVRGKSGSGAGVSTMKLHRAYLGSRGSPKVLYNQ